MQTNLAGRVALVTGGSQGIGKACAAALLAQDCRVVIAARNRAQLDTAAEELSALGGVTAVSADVADASQAQAAVDTAVMEYGRLDILVNSHGVLPDLKGFLDLTADDWSRTFDVNLWGVVNASQAAARELAQRGGGSIVTVVSINAVQAEPGMAPYNVSKGALEALTRSMAYDLAEHRIRVNAVSPGWVLTPMTEGYFADLRDKDLECNIVQRPGQPDEIAAVVAFLAGDSASYIAGMTITVDGGQTAILAPLRARQAV